MYFVFGIIFVLCVIFYIIYRFRAKAAFKKIRCMDFCEKLCTLNSLLQPFGFSFLPEEDIVTTLPDAWQREFGYRALYDKTASRFNMVFDSEPVYFDYNGRTWLIEFWKGQYGINLGSEIGIYCTDSVVPPERYRRTAFESVPDCQMLPFSMKLSLNGEPLFSVEGLRWWLTGFRVGAYCNPGDLSMHATVTFPDEEMLQSFTDSLIRLGYPERGICVCDLSVTFCFTAPHQRQRGLFDGLHAWFSQLENRLNCSLYRRITRPFSNTPDQILYLYYLLPFAFRHTMLFRRNRRQKPPKSIRKSLQRERLS